MDERERELERRVAQGEPGAEEALEAHRLRMGVVGPGRGPQVTPGIGRQIRNYRNIMLGVLVHTEDQDLPDQGRMNRHLKLTPEQVVSYIVDTPGWVNAEVYIGYYSPHPTYGRPGVPRFGGPIGRRYSDAAIFMFNNGVVDHGNHNGSWGRSGMQSFVNECDARSGERVADNREWWVDFFRRIVESDRNLGYQADPD